MRVLSSIERLVKIRCNGVIGPLTMMFGLSCLLVCNTRLQTVLNRHEMEPPYDVVDRLRKRLITQTMEQLKWTITYLGYHLLAVIAIDNQDTTNHHGIVVDGKNRYCLHLMAIEAVIFLFCGFRFSRPVKVTEADLERYMKVTDLDNFIESVVPAEYDSGLRT